MHNDDLLIPSLGTEDTITMSSPDLYDWDTGSPALTAASIDIIDLTSCSTTASTVTLNPNSFPYSNAISNGGYSLNTGAITGSLGSAGTLSSIYGAVPPQSVNIWADGSNVANPSGHIDLKGENADITINGRSLNKTIQALEERLNMLRPNEHLEAEWDQLRELGEAYRKLEADLIEKQRAWDVLKKQ